MPEYPYVECAEHPQDHEPGYAVCCHIYRLGREVSYVELATPEKLGVLMCADCEMTNPPLKNFTTICAQCCRESGWIE